MKWDWEPILAAGWIKTIDHFHELASTNDYAIQTATDRRPHPRLILCDRQQSGRGRGANRWTANEGALTFTLVIEPSVLGITRDRWPTLSVSVGGAICQALMTCAPRADIRMKWPNDVYANERKIAGVLVEMPPNRSDVLAVGIGINVLNHSESAPAEIRGRITSLIELCDEPHSLGDVLMRVLIQFRTDLHRLATDPVSLSSDWRQHCMLSGRIVSINDGIRVITGMCQGIDDDGALQIWTESGLQRCLGGTVVSFQ